MGSFVELEGPGAELAVLARRIHLDPGRALGGTYLELWEGYRACHPEVPADMVFA
ncbi:MAG: hypothetical protein V1750_08785 [Acidobacteriota bacterium]